MSTKRYTKSRFTANDAALVLIDHQSGILQLVRGVNAAQLAFAFYWSGRLVCRDLASTF